MARTAAEVVLALKADSAQYHSTLAAAGKQLDAYTAQVRKAAGVTRAESAATGNIAAQLQDIGVQLAGGQSPFLIALQQGSQLTQVLGQGGAAGAVGLLGGAVTSLLNPVSLATIGIIGLGGYAIQYFSEMVSGADEANAGLVNQEGLIGRVVQRWGEALPALAAYHAEQERQREDAEAAAGTQKAVNDAFVEAREQIVPLVSDVTFLAEELRAATENEARVRALVSAMLELQQKVDDGTATMQDLRAVSIALDAIQNDQVSTFATLSSAVVQYTSVLRDAVKAAAALNSQEAKRAGRGSSVISDRVGFDTTSPQVVLPGEAPTPGEKPLDDYFGMNDDDGSGRRAASAREKAVRDAERERQAVVDLIDTLEFERSLIGASNLEREKANALRRAGAAATPEQKAEIERLTETIYNENASLKAQQEAFRQLEQIGTNALNSLANAFSDGKLEASELLQIVANLAQQLLSMPSGGGGGLGGIIASLFGGGKSPLATAAIGAGRAFTYAKGTNYHPGGLARVNEQGGEIINLPRGSQVIPHDLSKRALNKPSSYTDRRTIHIDARGAQQGVGEEIRAALEAYDRSMPARLGTAMPEAMRRGYIR